MRFDSFQRSTNLLAVAAVATVISLAGHQTATAQQMAAKAELPPAELPISRVGDTSIWRNKKGEEITYETTGVDGEIVSVKDSTGCSWSVVEGFGPSVEWSGCGGSAGTQKIKTREGNLFPLQVGNTVRWKFRGKNKKGYSWTGDRKCNVKGTANVTVPAGNFDIYHVVCTEQWSRREYYYAPELGRSVKYRQKPRGNSRTKPVDSELVSFTPGA